jgi:hypothetical protein
MHLIKTAHRESQPKLSYWPINSASSPKSYFHHSEDQQLVVLKWPAPQSFVKLSPVNSRTWLACAATLCNPPTVFIPLQLSSCSRWRRAKARKWLIYHVTGHELDPWSAIFDRKVHHVRIWHQLVTTGNWCGSRFRLHRKVFGFQAKIWPVAQMAHKSCQARSTRLKQADKRQWCRKEFEC